MSPILTNRLRKPPIGLEEINWLVDLSNAIHAMTSPIAYQIPVRIILQLTLNLLMMEFWQPID